MENNSKNYTEKLKNVEEHLLYEIAAAAIKTQGVYSLAGRVSKENLLENKGKALLKKGIKITKDKESVRLDIYLIVEYGYKIPEIAWAAQRNIDKAVKEIEGIPVSAINIHINGIRF